MAKAKPRVLVVDDHPEYRRIVMEMLLRITGCHYQVFQSGYGGIKAGTAFDSAVQHKVDVIIAQGHRGACDGLVDRLAEAESGIKLLSLIMLNRGDNPREDIWPAKLNGEEVPHFDQHELHEALLEILEPQPIGKKKAKAA